MRYWNMASPYIQAGSSDSTKWMYACVRYNGSTLVIDGNFNGTAKFKPYVYQLSLLILNKHFVLKQ